MIFRYFQRFFLLAGLSACFFPAFAQDLILADKTTKASIVYDAKGPALDSISAYLLQQDIQRITGVLPAVFTDISKAKGTSIIIGNINSALISGLLPAGSSLKQELSGKWECYAWKTLSKPVKNIDRALVIAGSDTRGTAYGVFSLSEKIGVSPWYWWADVTPARKNELRVSIADYVSVPPSVKYRGIFLNDEDWGLQPWAAKTFEPETGDIGPKTYSRIFELLLRLKANLIWPAMHPSTKAFYSYPGNGKVAADYSIVIGSSHAEPMLRNNVGEWSKDMGAFNYLTNKEKVYNYWEQRVKESSRNDAMYSLGMRGVHDSGMEGVKSVNEAVPLLHRIFEDQRGMLTKYIPKKITDIPQVFTAYKEVLEIYDNNLQLPADVTLVWPDDNYGYIQRLNNEKESLRPGGSGVYYHASYWGRPHDYLWISSTHPGLIREEMMKAYETKSDRLWVLNVGDLKPLEYNISFFLDMAYAAGPFKNPEYTKKHLNNWVQNVFGQTNSAEISQVLWKYYDLAFERRPEFMGWSQTEPTTKINYSTYNHFYYGDEAQRRIDSYNALETAVKTIRPKIPAKDADAFYQLVYYPVTGASLMNKKFLYRDKSYLYAQQNRISAKDYATLSDDAYQAIVKETDYYNNQLAGGKWKNMMSMTPRNLPVYQKVDFPEIRIDQTGAWSIAPEGFVRKDSALISRQSPGFALPVFNRQTDRSYFIDVFLSDNKEIAWTAVSDSKWIRLSQVKGTLNPGTGKNQVRIWVSVDWPKVGATKADGLITFSAAGKTLPVRITASDASATIPRDFKGHLENNGYISIPAAHYTRNTAKNAAGWKLIEGVGNSEGSLISGPLATPSVNTANPNNLETSAPSVEYEFYTLNAAKPEVTIFTLPTHPLTTGQSMRYAVSIDNGPIQLLDFKTSGRTEEWKQNVLSNRAKRRYNGQSIDPGKHTLRIFMVDPGVVLQNITINTGGLKEAYSTIPETKRTNH